MKYSQPNQEALKKMIGIFDYLIRFWKVGWAKNFLAFLSKHLSCRRKINLSLYILHMQEKQSAFLFEWFLFKQHSEAIEIIYFFLSHKKTVN